MREVIWFYSQEELHLDLMAGTYITRGSWTLSGMQGPFGTHSCSIGGRLNMFHTWEEVNQISGKWKGKLNDAISLPSLVYSSSWLCN
jgi:hypothetical protein